MRGLMTEQPKSEDRVQRLKPLTDFYGEDRHELVQKLAYQLWEKRGSPIARTSVMGYKHKDARLDQIGRDLSVQYVLENSLRESGDHIRLPLS